MEFSKEIQEKAKELFKDEPLMLEKILSGDVNAIKEIGHISQWGLKPEEVVNAFETKDSKAMYNLYNQCKRLVMLNELYQALCIEFCDLQERKTK